MKKVKARNCLVISNADEENVFNKRLCPAISSEVLGMVSSLRTKDIIGPTKDLIDLSGCGPLPESMSSKVCSLTLFSIFLYCLSLFLNLSAYIIYFGSKLLTVYFY